MLIAMKKHLQSANAVDCARN